MDEIVRRQSDRGIARDVPAATGSRNTRKPGSCRKKRLHKLWHHDVDDWALTNAVANVVEGE